MIKEALLCLTQAVYFEASGEDFIGKVAVAQVVINRSQDDDFPNDICKVVRQPGQFAPAARSGAEMKDDDVEEEAKAAALVALISPLDIVTDNALYFHNGSVRPSWSKRMTPTVKIGNHQFYR